MVTLVARRTIQPSARVGDEEMVTEKFKGIDICFEELTLLVKVGGKDLNIVDAVTGRVRAGTMTALLGGSGVGRFLGF